jgi:hypothetical protein
VRFIGLDVHLDFCEIAICDAGRVRSGCRVPTSAQGLAILANSLAPDDQVALEATGNALAIARVLEPHVARIVVASRTELRAITEAKVKTDRRDARTPAVPRRSWAVFEPYRVRRARTTGLWSSCSYRELGPSSDSKARADGPRGRM